jgi:hypothetical protein
MSRKTIAPTLAYILDQRETAGLEPEALRLGREARAELRALLAVARAVTKGIAHTDWCGMQTGEECCCPSQDALRAAARLYPSKAKPRRRDGKGGAR